MEWDRLVKFSVLHIDKDTHARAGLLETGHGSVETPVFMPVGTLGAVKGVEPVDLQSCGYGLILNNAYHMYLRPGHEVVASLGGLHGFTSWPGSILTDSGGYQIFSLATLRRISDEGVTFQSHRDGSLHHLTPERATEIQEALGADIIMAFDECIALPSPRDGVEQALRRTRAWAARCLSARKRTDQAMFGIIQGGQDQDLRVHAARDLLPLGFDGYAIGGLSVGEDKEVMYRMLDVTVPELPALQPRYLMGVGMPENLVEGVARGIDMFDCVVPTRHGRTGWLFTSFGRVVIKQARYVQDERPIDARCGCPVCRRYSRAYLHHLFGVNEMLGVRLNTLHNLYYFADLMRQIRRAIIDRAFLRFREHFFAQRDLAGEALSGDEGVAAVMQDHGRPHR